MTDEPFAIERDDARTRGVSVVFGDVLADNKSMLGLAHSRGFEQKLLAGEPGVVEVSLAL